MNTLALCIPAYNAGTYLPRLLTSAKEQAIKFDEILVYDDCSTDNTKAVAKQYGAKVISGDVNRGCSYGKNVLAQNTHCNWVHFHDADDDLLPQFTAEVQKWISNKGNRYDILLLNYKYIDAVSHEFLGDANHNAKELHQDALLYAIKNKIVNFGVYNRQTFLKAGGFDLDPKVLYNEDNALHHRLAKQGLKFDYLPEITCINYRYINSMSASNQLKCVKANYHVLAKTAKTHGDRYPQELADKLWVCIASLAAKQDWEYVKKALRLCDQLGYKYSGNGSKTFNMLTYINPYSAVWFREKMVRLFKPHLRKNE
jgi:glycosyltransferase involved in cell wall biosynthesis